MPKQSHDHSSFIQGTLTKYRRVGWTKQVVLGEGVRSLWLMQAKHIDHSDSRRGIEIQIQQYKKRTNTESFGEPVKTFVLSEGAVVGLFDFLQQQQALEHVALGSRYLALPVSGSPGLSDKNVGVVVSLLQELLSSGELERLLDSGVLTKQSLRHIGVVAQHLHYKLALQELEELLESETDETVYQKWFTNNPWIFGTTYIQRRDARKVGLRDITDMLLETTDGYLDLIELKRPDVPVLQYDKSRKLYYFSPDVSLAVAQCANYIVRTEENRHMLAAREKMIFLKPRARVIVGRKTASWTDAHSDALRTLNGSLHFIEVWTYDHLVAMGRRLVDLYEKRSSPSSMKS